MQKAKVDLLREEINFKLIFSKFFSSNKIDIFFNTTINQEKQKINILRYQVKIDLI